MKVNFWLKNEQRQFSHRCNRWIVEHTSQKMKIWYAVLRRGLDWPDRYSLTWYTGNCNNCMKPLCWPRIKVLVPPVPAPDNFLVFKVAQYLFCPHCGKMIEAIFIKDIPIDVTAEYAAAGITTEGEKHE